MLFYVYDKFGRELNPVYADDATDAINKARSRTNQFPMVVSEREHKQQQQDAYNWQGEYYE